MAKTPLLRALEAFPVLQEPVLRTELERILALSGGTASSSTTGVFNVLDFDSTAGTGGDDTVAIQSAIDAAAVSNQRGTVLIPSGRIFYCASPLVPKAGVRLVGEGTRTGGVQTTSRVIYTGSGSNTFLDATSLSGFALENLFLQYNHASYTGTFVDASSSAYFYAKNCFFTGGASAYGSPVLVQLNGSQLATLEECTFGWATNAIYGQAPGAGFTTVVTIRNCVFNGTTTSAPIWNPHVTWNLENNTFEGITGYTVAAGLDHDASVLAQGLRVVGSWCGDAGAAGAWFKVAGKGLSFSGNNIGGGAIGISLDEVSHGVSIAGGNVFPSCGTSPIDLNNLAHVGVTIMGNDISVGAGAKIANRALTTRRFFVGNNGGVDILDVSGLVAYANNAAAAAVEHATNIYYETGTDPRRVAVVY